MTHRTRLAACLAVASLVLSPTLVNASASTFVSSGYNEKPSSGCTRTNSGKCVKAGQYCKSSEKGHYGQDAQGRRLYCSPQDRHWHYA
jgi:hypothetical protein